MHLNSEMEAAAAATARGRGAGFRVWYGPECRQCRLRCVDWYRLRAVLHMRVGEVGNVRSGASVCYGRRFWRKGGGMYE